MARMRLDETLHRRDDDVAPGQAPDIEGRGAAHRERPKRIGERRAGRAQAGLKRKDARIRAVEPESRRDLALARSTVGLPRRRVLDAVVGRRGDQGQPIRQAIFDVGSKFELSIGRNWNETPVRTLMGTFPTTIVATTKLVAVSITDTLLEPRFAT